MKRAHSVLVNPERRIHAETFSTGDIFNDNYNPNRNHEDPFTPIQHADRVRINRIKESLNSKTEFIDDMIEADVNRKPTVSDSNKPSRTVVINNNQQKSAKFYSGKK